MPDHPLILTAEQIRAVLREIDAPGAGKTQHRVVLKPQPDQRTTEVSVCRGKWMGSGPSVTGGTNQWDRWQSLPFCAGDRLWVREHHYRTDDGYQHCVVPVSDEEAVAEHLAAVENQFGPVPSDLKASHLKIHPPSRMPRYGSHLTLLITEVRVQRLQDISEADARAEGWLYADADPTRIASGETTPLGWFRMRHETRHGPDAWAVNPWVAALTFAPIAGNIDTTPRPTARGETEEHP